MGVGEGAPGEDGRNGEDGGLFDLPSRGGVVGGEVEEDARDMANNINMFCSKSELRVRELLDEQLCKATRRGDQGRNSKYALGSVTVM